MGSTSLKNSQPFPEDKFYKRLEKATRAVSSDENFVKFVMDNTSMKALSRLYSKVPGEHGSSGKIVQAIGEQMLFSDGSFTANLPLGMKTSRNFRFVGKKGLRIYDDGSHVSASNLLLTPAPQGHEFMGAASSDSSKILVLEDGTLISCDYNQSNVVELKQVLDNAENTVHVSRIAAMNERLMVLDNGEARLLYMSLYAPKAVKNLKPECLFENGGVVRSNAVSVCNSGVGLVSDKGEATVAFFEIGGPTAGLHRFQVADKGVSNIFIIKSRYFMQEYHVAFAYLQGRDLYFREIFPSPKLPNSFEMTNPRRLVTVDESFENGQIIYNRKPSTLSRVAVPGSVEVKLLTGERVFVNVLRKRDKNPGFVNWLGIPSDCTGKELLKYLRYSDAPAWDAVLQVCVNDLLQRELMKQMKTPAGLFSMTKEVPRYLSWIANCYEGVQFEFNSSKKVLQALLALKS